jgi:hypothetical protein
MASCAPRNSSPGPQVAGPRAGVRWLGLRLTRSAVLVALVGTSCQARPAERRSSAASAPSSVERRVSSVPPSSVPAPAPAPTGVSAPEAAPILDQAKGRQAVASYRKFLARLCRSIASDAGDRAERLRAVGLHDDAMDDVLCSNDPGSVEALASGSLMRAGADEVLLQMTNGRATAAGERTLVLMRSDGAGYRFAEHVVGGNHFEANLRLIMPAGRDILMLCNHGGHAGFYPSTCGFLGQGSFSHGYPENGASTKHELTLFRTTLCGSGADVRLGHLTPRGDRLSVELVVVAFVRDQYQDASEGTPELDCPRETNRTTQRFIVQYELGAQGARRLTPTPREVRDVLDRGNLPSE